MTTNTATAAAFDLLTPEACLAGIKEHFGVELPAFPYGASRADMDAYGAVVFEAMESVGGDAWQGHGSAFFEDLNCHIGDALLED